MDCVVVDAVEKGAFGFCSREVIDLTGEDDARQKIADNVHEGSNSQQKKSGHTRLYARQKIADNVHEGSNSQQKKSGHTRLYGDVDEGSNSMYEKSG